MINKILIVLFFCFTNNFIFFELKSQIKNNIVVKVGNSLISSIDIQNEIITSIIINKQKITQTNIDNYKNYAIKKLIKSTIKRNEIEKYDVKNYDPIALNNYIDNVAKNLNTNKVGLKKIFTETGINYDLFVNNHRTELLWNTLIFQIYNNQININIIEVENEIEKIKEKKSLDELKK